VWQLIKIGWSRRCAVAKLAQLSNEDFCTEEVDGDTMYSAPVGVVLPVGEQAETDVNALRAVEPDVLAKKTSDEMRWLKHEAELLIHAIDPERLDVVDVVDDGATQSSGSTRQLLLEHRALVNMSYILLHAVEASVDEVHQSPTHERTETILQPFLDHQLFLLGGADVLR